MEKHRIAGVPLNNFSYADDLALVAPSAGGLNQLLKICDRIALEDYIIYSSTKSVRMFMQSNNKLKTMPNIYQSDTNLFM